jgi:CubicO group peptidase (beta-lactamase class C family)
MRVAGDGVRTRRSVWARAVAVLAIVAILIVPFVGGEPAAGVDPQAPWPAFVAHLETSIPRRMAAFGVPGVAVALVVDGEPVWSGAYGDADRDEGRPMTVDTYLRTESISKSVTAWGVMRLVELGLVGLDDPVVRHLRTWGFPDPSDAGASVTIRQLLANTGGLRHGDIDLRYAPGAERPSLRTSLTGQAGFDREPGTGFAYSNVGFNLLEVLIEDVSGQDFSAFMEEQVFAPLGLQRTTFTWQAGLSPEVPMGHDLAGRPTPPYVYAERASGGLLATVDDVARFVAAGMPASTTAGAVLAPSTIAEMHAPQVQVAGYMGAVYQAYGLGHFVETLPNGMRAVSHGGQGYGWMTHFHAVPDSGDGIVLLTNSQRSWPLFARVLNDWARWRGFPSVGMGRIRVAEAAMWAIVAVLLFASLWMGWGLVVGLASGRRRFAPHARSRLASRHALALAAIAILLGLGWAARQAYLFLPSVFPTAWPWFTSAAFGLAVVVLVAAACPDVDRGPRDGP